MPIRKADFKPAWWLRSPHLQTLWPVFLKKRHKLDLFEERLELDDGDFVDLCWSKKQSGRHVLVLHGLEGSIDSHYANSIMYQLELIGYIPVFMHFRGCSGELNRLPRAYHSGETGDLATVVEHIFERTGEYPYATISYSLGANVLLKWLGETGENNPLKKAIAVSVPFLLQDAAKRLEQGISKIYRDHLLSSLRKTYIEKFQLMRSPIQVDVNQLESFREYDDKVTAPLHGFDSVQDYYDRCSCRQFLKRIKVKTQIIHASDDPFVFVDTVPRDDELNENIDLLLSSHGGHVGFISAGSLTTTYSWCDRKIIEFLSGE